LWLVRGEGGGWGVWGGRGLGGEGGGVRGGGGGVHSMVCRL